MAMTNLEKNPTGGIRNPNYYFCSEHSRVEIFRSVELHGGYGKMIQMSDPSHSFGRFLDCSFHIL